MTDYIVGRIEGGGLVQDWDVSVFTDRRKAAIEAAEARARGDERAATRVFALVECEFINDRPAAREPESVDDLVTYMTTSAIANELGVSRATVTMWCTRHPNAVPKPDARQRHRGMTIDLWRADRLDEWKRWMRYSAG